MLLYTCKYLVIISVLLPCSFGFNLDTNNIIIYEDPQIGNSTRDTYFGFSVLLYSGSSTSESWVQIGAPRGNNTHLRCVNEPGVVFRCPIAKPCEALKLDYQNDKQNCYKEYVEQRNNAWYGGAMDLAEVEGSAVICGHRRKAGLSKNRQIRIMIGSCFVQDIKSSHNSTECLPLNYPDRYITDRFLDFGVGQAGISVHFPQNKKSSELLIGASGVLNWRGSTALYKKAKFSTRYGSPDIINPNKTKSTNLFAYELFGYQVNSGKFNNRSMYVGSIPRGADVKGRVILYEYAGNEYINVIKPLDGEQTGEYFGASLAVVDINGDGSDDLIVGAPQHTVTHDEGCIYVFFANSQNTVLDKKPKIEGKITGGRFGTSIAVLGDVDRDGFKDIAVGAPYESEDTGAIYIYNGGRSGLTFSQKITAQEIYPKLKGFGISIARAADIDNNMYNDIAVGAFKSGHVVIFRAQPVVTLSTYFDNVVTQIKENDKEFDVTICYTYKGIGAPKSLKVLRTVTLDENHKRWSMKEDITRTIEVKKPGVPACENFKVFLTSDDEKRNLIDPINIKVKQELIKEEQNKTLLLIGNTFKNEEDGFKKDIPVVNKQTSDLMNEVDIPLATDCKGICNAALHLVTSFPDLINGTYVIGSKPKLLLHITLTNTGETAYNAIANVTIPFPVQLSSGNRVCQEKRLSLGLQLTCLVDSRLKNGMQKNLTLQLDMSNVESGTQNVMFQISASTKSNDKNKLNIPRLLQLKMTTDADAIITGKPVKAIHSYFNVSENIFTHRYEVQKQGVSPLESVEIALYIPQMWTDSIGNNITILNIYDPKAEMNNRQPLKCSSEIKYKSENTENEEGSIRETYQRQKRDLLESDLSEVQSEARYQPPANRTLYINCSTENVVCSSIICIAGPFNSIYQTSASVQIQMAVNVSELGLIMGEKDIVNLATSGSVSIKTRDGEQKSTRPHSITVATSFTNTTTYIESPGKPVANWIIALAIIAGIFIFMLIVIGLIKAGFFERKKKEELKALMAVDAMNEFAVGKVNNTEGVNQELEEDE